MTATQPRAVRVEAPAKVNLLLRILARETSGYHTLESLFVKLALHDVVTVHTDTTTRSLTCEGPAMPAGGLGAPEQNLAWRAAVRFAEVANWPTGFAITIDKQIPVGGGLGGGSADAAGVLRALNAIAPVPLAPAVLLALAGELGSDVPFLASDAVLAWTWGRGDRLLALPALPPMTVQLVTFQTGVNTAAAYAALAASRATATSRAAGAAAAGGSVGAGAYAYPADAFANWRSIGALATNDFEGVVPSLHEGVAAWLPMVHAAAARLRGANVPAVGLLSGSGATCALVHPTGATIPTELTSAGVTLPFGARLLTTATATAIVGPAPID
jgi:4-diphosphocytidyl-2-C-methyl-D-erythritol kinase